MTEPQQPKAAPQPPTNTIDNSLDEILEQLLPAYERGTYNGDEALSKAKAAINKTIMEEVQEIVDSTEYMHSIDSENNVRRFIHADKFKQLLAKKYGRADNDD